jgi:hypothetical protein
VNNEVAVKPRIAYGFFGMRHKRTVWNSKMVVIDELFALKG